MIVAIMITFCFTATLFIVIPIRSANNPYDPWIDYNDDGKISLQDLVSLANSYGTSGDPAKNVNVTNNMLMVNGTDNQNVNVTNWPSQLLSNYVYDSGSFTLGTYGNNSQTYRDLSIAGYRQVSVYVSFDNSLDVSLEIRVGMGNFSGVGIAGYNWATYYNISTVTGQFIPPFTQTVNVQGPQLRIEVYNDENCSIDFMHIVAYVTC